MLMLFKQNIRISVSSFNTVTGHKKPSTALSANTGEVKTSSSQDMTSDACGVTEPSVQSNYTLSIQALLPCEILHSLIHWLPLHLTHCSSLTSWLAAHSGLQSWIQAAVKKKKSPGPNTAETLWALLLIRLSPENPGGTSCNWAPCSLHQWLFSTRPAPGATWGALTSAGGPDPHRQPALV